MSTLYLHIGTQKTGTTSLQFFLKKNDRALLEYGYLYPILDYEFEDIHPTRNGHFLIEGLYEKTAKTRKHNSRLFNEGLSKILEYLAKYNVILTDESIWYCSAYYPPFFKQLREKIEKAGHKLKVIVYLRRQDLFLQSYWSHKVRMGETLSFKKYVKKEKYKFCRLDYYTRLEEISAAVGKENIIVRPYEKSQFQAGTTPADGTLGVDSSADDILADDTPSADTLPAVKPAGNNSIFADFLYAVGINYDDTVFVPALFRNLGMNTFCTELKRKLNAKEEFSEAQEMLTRHLRDISAKTYGNPRYQLPSYFTPDLLDSFMKKYAEENRRVAVEYLNRPDGNLFNDPMVTIPDESALNFKTEDYVSLIGHFAMAVLETENSLIARKMLYRERIDQLEHRFPNQILHAVKSSLKRLGR